MNNEIKEIREYISCPQFGDDHYGKWGALRLEQRIKIKSLLDYITNLQQENERKERLITQYGEGMCAYANRIDKAIEYIKEHNPSDIGICGNEKKYYYTLDENSVDNLLNILQKGSDEK